MAKEQVTRIALIEDRYDGQYSGGEWFGVLNPNHPHGSTSRGAFVIDSGPSGDEKHAAAFWRKPPDWVVVGKSPKHVIELIKDRPLPSVLQKVEKIHALRTQGMPWHSIADEFGVNNYTHLHHIYQKWKHKLTG
jgi:hypothetical protein